MPTTTHTRRESPLPPSLPAPLIIATLHDHDTLVRLNPLVISVTPLPSPPAYAPEEFRALPWVKVVDEISYLPAGLWKGAVEYEACFEDLVDGVRGMAWAPMGVVTRSTWRVLEGEGEGDGKKGLVLREDCETTCAGLIMPFVKRTQGEAHKTMISRIREKLEGGRGE